MVDLLRHIRDLEQNIDPSAGRFWPVLPGPERASGPIDLNGAHFHSEIVSLPQCLIPMNIAPPAPDGANDV